MQLGRIPSVSIHPTMILNPYSSKSTLTPLLEIFHSPFSNISPNSHRTIHPPRNSNEYKLLLLPEFSKTKTLVLSRLIKDTKTFPHSPPPFPINTTFLNPLLPLPQPTREKLPTKHEKKLPQKNTIFLPNHTHTSLSPKPNQTKPNKKKQKKNVSLRQPNPPPSHHPRPQHRRHHRRDCGSFRHVVAEVYGGREEGCCGGCLRLRRWGFFGGVGGGRGRGGFCVYMENVLCLGFVVFFCTYKIHLFACIQVPFLLKGFHA